MRSISVPLPVLIILSILLVVSLSIAALKSPDVVTRTYTTTPSWVKDLNRTYNGLLSSYEKLNLSYESLLDERDFLRKSLEELNRSYSELVISFRDLKAENDRLRDEYSQLLSQFFPSEVYHVVTKDVGVANIQLEQLRTKINELFESEDPLSYYKANEDLEKLIP